MILLKTPLLFGRDFPVSSFIIVVAACDGGRDIAKAHLAYQVFNNDPSKDTRPDRIMLMIMMCRTKDAVRISSDMRQPYAQLFVVLRRA